MGHPPTILPWRLHQGNRNVSGPSLPIQPSPFAKSSPQQRFVHYQWYQYPYYPCTPYQPGFKWIISTVATFSIPKKNAKRRSTVWPHQVEDLHAGSTSRRFQVEVHLQAEGLWNSQSRLKNAVFLLTPCNHVKKHQKHMWSSYNNMIY